MAKVEHYRHQHQSRCGLKIDSPFFSFISLACCGVRGFSSTLGVIALSSLPLFGALADLAFVAFFFADGSATGVLGVDSFSFVAVFGVFAGYN